MSTFQNSKVGKFFNELALLSLDDDDSNLTIRCKFNFSYFHTQDCSQDFPDWTPEQLHKLFEKLRGYSQQSLDYWQKQRIGGHGKVLAIYNEFPKNSDFKRPKHVPHEVAWGRFRLESAVRLVGFVVPESHVGKSHDKTGQPYDKNTFYVVYLDKDLNRHDFSRHS